MSFRRPGRPSSNIDDYQDEISSSFKNGRTLSDIAQALSDKYNITVHHRTIQRRIKQWGVQRYSITAPEELENEIKRLYFEKGLSDNEIRRALQQQGTDISPYALAAIRARLGLKRRVVDSKDIQNMDDVVKEAFQKELESGRLEGYGRGNLFRYFRSLGYNISRDRLFNIARELAPEGIIRRKKDIYRRRGELVVPGPNYMWSIDGHDKLAFWGIQIYAGIDAYSRYITWCYIGISNRTQISVLRQFLEVLEEKQIQPRFIRSDKGGETVQLAAAHYLLLKQQFEDISLDACYWYGTSTSNQRIEAWWSQLTKSLLFIFRDFFMELSQNGHFKKTVLADRIALLAVYMPIVRKEITIFVNLWNTHTIRKQPYRSQSIKGQPYVLYHQPPDNVRNYGLKPNEVILQQLINENHWDLDEYLPFETLNWCKYTLQMLGFQNIGLADFMPNGERTHYAAYLSLKEQIAVHIDSQLEPRLAECVKPTQNEQELTEDLQRIVIDLENQPWFIRK